MSRLPRVKRALRAVPAMSAAQDGDRTGAAAAGPVVTLGANRDVQLVSMIFGDPLATNPLFVTFTPQQAREIGGMLHQYADIAEGKQPS